jgi:DMSO/TMAO reductase YedYZ molybdopterin-dependent catalytic subunit
MLACRSRARSATERPEAHFDGYPIGRLDSLVTPTADFFVRDHFGVPAAASQAAAEWKLEVDGEVRRSLILGAADFPSLPALQVPVTLECAGNAGRNGLGWSGGPRAWGGASTATFGGYALAEVVGRAGPSDSAREVVFEGADEGSEAGSVERNAFARSVPLGVALSPTAILATSMNGNQLPVQHGGPLRVIFPGRYACDSIKWLRRIHVVSQPFDGFYQRRRYRRAAPDDAVGEPVGELRVQSEIARPKPGDRLPSGMLVDIAGAAWGGRGGIAKVEVSVDGGETFAEARFIDPEQPNCWRRWIWSWRPDHPGPRLILARATDRAGQAQPLASDEELGIGYSLSGPDRIQYANNSVPVIAVTVA